MGSSSSRNAVDSSSFSSSSSSPAEANEPRRSVGHQRFRSRCFRSSSKSPENSLNPAAHEEAFGWPIPLGSMHDVGEEADPQKYLSGKLKCIPKSSTNCNQICNKRLFRSVSHASTSSIQVCNAQEAEPSSSLRSRSSSRGESNSANTSCSNDSRNSDVKLSRATSLGSAGSHSLFARRQRCQPSSIEQNTRSDNEHLINGTDQHRVQDNRPHNLCESRSRQQHVSSIQARFQEDADNPSGSLEWGNTFSESASISETGNRNSQQHMTFSINQPTVHVESVAESRDARRTHRRGTPENVESNVNFRRSRSVGRLRDRVLRRTSSSENSFSIPQGDSMDREIRRHNGRRFWEALTRASSNRHAGTSSNVAQDQFLRTLRSMSASRRQREDRREVSDRTSNNNSTILENRRLYLEERRRRARSQVRALQRLSSSFENLAGHERACILAGHHRTSRCSCQNVGRTDDSNTRASISRIIMLAEALFEVLDEIHHQSMALSSPSSVSSLGSFPAPDDIVESIPVRLYSKHDKSTNEDTAQCYICLVEYEEGDHVRVLPCHHEFHQLCVDKWLKEVHRVCPLCRGNVCDNSLRTHAGDL